MADVDALLEPQLAQRSIHASRQFRYDVRQSPNLLSDGFGTVVELLSGRSGLIVTTPTVARLYGGALIGMCAERGLDYALHVIECREDQKSLALVENVCAAAC